MFIVVISIPVAVAMGLIAKTAIECSLYNIPVAAKVPKALVALAVDSVVMIVGLPIAYRIRGKEE